MKLTDIRKLKVAELRLRLKEAGLDSKGLKAELVDRLWFALTAGQGGADGGEEVNHQHDGSATPSSPAALADPAEPPVSPSLPAERVRDCATQTGPEFDSEGGSACPSEGGESGRPPVGVSPGPSVDRGRAFYEFKEEIRYKRTKSPQLFLETEETRDEDKDLVRLDPYACHLHFEVGQDGACGQPRFWDRFPLLWSGCRLSHGVMQGRVGFEVRLEGKLLSMQKEHQDGVHPYGMRIGWSVADSPLLLGEEEFSFAYDYRGKKVSHGTEGDFGEHFAEGDIIGCYASFSVDGGVQLSFHKNGRFMGVAFSLEAGALRGRALFPHVLCKSCSIRFLLDPTAPPWYPVPPGFTLLGALPAGQRVRAKPASYSRAQCEMVLMVGLPASGKSHWARTHLQQHPEKHYQLLGTEELLRCMISGTHPDSRLRQASQCLTELIKIAAQTPGNYILDQCNTLFSAQRYKLQLFTGFRRKAVVIFPSAEEWKKRQSKHQTQDGEQIPQTALLKLQVSCTLPEQQSDLLEELQYEELPQEEAQKLLQEYKDEARRLLPPVPKPEKKKRLQRKRNHLQGHPPTHWRKLRLTGCRSPRPNMQPWNQQPPYWTVDQQGYYKSCYEGCW